jgi:DNA-3-methyladenine glycosylase I
LISVIPEVDMERIRCKWAQSNPLFFAYHDEEWGIPEHDDRRLFEMLNLEGAQAGLSWFTILRKRDGYRRAFDGFDAAKIARYGAAKRSALLRDEGIVRNRLKIDAVIANAKAFLAVRNEFGTFDAFVWRFVDAKPVRGPGNRKAVAASEAMSRELRRRGFRFVGPTICYAFMQAVGMVNDHARGCFRRVAFRPDRTPPRRPIIPV